MGYPAYGSHGFKVKSRGEEKKPIKKDAHSGQGVPANCSSSGTIVGSNQAGGDFSKSKAIEKKGFIIGGDESQPGTPSATSINKLPSGGDTEIV